MKQTISTHREKERRLNFFKAVMLRALTGASLSSLSVRRRRKNPACVRKPGRFAVVISTHSFNWPLCRTRPSFVVSFSRVRWTSSSASLMTATVGRAEIFLSVGTPSNLSVALWNLLSLPDRDQCFIPDLKIERHGKRATESFDNYTDLCLVYVRFHLFSFQVAIRLAGPCRRQRPERVRMIIHRTTTGCSGTIKHSVSCLTVQHESRSFEVGFGRELELNLRSTCPFSGRQLWLTHGWGTKSIPSVVCSAIAPCERKRNNWSETWKHSVTSTVPLFSSWLGPRRELVWKGVRKESMVFRCHIHPWALQFLIRKLQGGRMPVENKSLINARQEELKLKQLWIVSHHSVIHSRVCRRKTGFIYWNKWKEWKIRKHKSKHE